MENALGTVFSPAKTRKALARVALVDVKESARTVLSECFRQFGIETVVMSDTAADRLKREKFEAYVVRLCPETEPILEAARTSPSNNRMVIYGMGGTIQDAMKYSRYGINAVFNEPIERPSALKLVRATQMLVLHEFRRYVRIPVITEVSLALADGARFSASSQEISSGGMSLRSAQDVSPGQAVEISFALLTLPRIWVRSTVSWRMPGNKTFGVRFDAQDERRQRVKEWIESYLDN
ncbi:MAG TPA: PilZ domain-containing protein [Terriglobales bacterium]|nr:PilZ domain-containing protein [Terriglobales bacterium]